MKRYLLFIGNIYNPQGGMNDLVAQSNNVVALIDCLNNQDLDDVDNWWHIYDTIDGEIVLKSVGD